MYHNKIDIKGIEKLILNPAKNMLVTPFLA